jgi:hypothetical protein
MVSYFEHSEAKGLNILVAAPEAGTNFITLPCSTAWENLFLS